MWVFAGGLLMFVCHLHSGVDRWGFSWETLTVSAVYQFVFKAMVGSRHHGVMRITLSSPDEYVLELE